MRELTHARIPIIYDRKPIALLSNTIVGTRSRASRTAKPIVLHPRLVYTLISCFGVSAAVANYHDRL
ncbi:hypothetical protein AB1N83_013965 [Pleurotus pulmonarius]